MELIEIEGIRRQTNYRSPGFQIKDARFISFKKNRLVMDLSCPTNVGT